MVGDFTSSRQLIERVSQLPAIRTELRIDCIALHREIQHSPLRRERVGGNPLPLEQSDEGFAHQQHLARIELADEQRTDFVRNGSDAKPWETNKTE